MAFRPIWFEGYWDGDFPRSYDSIAYPLGPGHLLYFTATAIRTGGRPTETRFACYDITKTQARLVARRSFPWADDFINTGFTSMLHMGGSRYAVMAAAWGRDHMLFWVDVATGEISAPFSRNRVIDGRWHTAGVHLTPTHQVVLTRLDGLLTDRFAGNNAQDSWRLYQYPWAMTETGISMGEPIIEEWVPPPVTDGASRWYSTKLVGGLIAPSGQSVLLWDLLPDIRSEWSWSSSPIYWSRQEFPGPPAPLNYVDHQNFAGYPSMALVGEDPLIRYSWDPTWTAPTTIWAKQERYWTPGSLVTGPYLHGQTGWENGLGWGRNGSPLASFLTNHQEQSSVMYLITAAGARAQWTMKSPPGAGVFVEGAMAVGNEAVAFIGDNSEERRAGVHWLVPSGDLRKGPHRSGARFR